MARNRFGGTASDFVFATYLFGGHDLVQLTTAQVTCWSAPPAVAGRVQYTDLRLLDGTAVSTIQANEDGSLPEFGGPDDATVTRMWVSADGGATGVWLTTSSIPSTPADIGADPAGTAQQLVDELVASAPGTLDTLNELAAALGDDPDFAGTVVQELAAKVDEADLDTQTASLVDTPGSELGTRLAAAYASKAVEQNALTAEEVAMSLILDPGSIAANRTQPFFVAPYPCRIEQLSLAFAAAVAASDTDYWTVELLRYRNGAATYLASKTTKTVASGGEGVTAYQDWNFDTVGFFPSAAELAKGDVLTVRLTPTGTPSALSAPTATFRSTPSDGGAPVVLTQDDFERADTTAGLGTTPTGQPWVIEYGSWGITSGLAYSPTPTYNEQATIDVGASDVAVQVKLAAVNGSIGLMLRATDDHNSIMLNTSQFIRHQNGANTTVGTLSQTFGSGDTMRVHAFGPTFAIYRQAGSTGPFVLVNVFTEPFNQTATKHGFRMSTNTGGSQRLDNFLVTEA